MKKGCPEQPFFIIFALLISPIMGGKPVIIYADDLLNQLTKGSVYEIPCVASKAKIFEGKSFEVTVDPSLPLYTSWRAYRPLHMGRSQRPGENPVSAKRPGVGSVGRRTLPVSVNV
jgi:hypothetical protein